MAGSNIRIVIALAGLSAAHAASAQGIMRCGGKIVETGMTTTEVETHCGTPAAVETEEQNVLSGNRVVGTTEVQHWIYRQTGSLPRALVFDRDKLIEIRLLEH